MTLLQINCALLLVEWDLLLKSRVNQFLANFPLFITDKFSKQVSEIQSCLWMRTLPSKFPQTTAGMNFCYLWEAALPQALLHVQMLVSLCHLHPAVAPMDYSETQRNKTVSDFGDVGLCFPFGYFQVWSWWYWMVTRGHGADVAAWCCECAALSAVLWAASVDTSKSWYFWDGECWKCFSTSGTSFFDSG